MAFYRINSTVFPDVNGNFSLSAEDLGVSPEVHLHDTSMVEGLEEALIGKSAASHSHDYISSIFGLTGNIVLTGDAYLGISKNGSTFTLSSLSETATPPSSVKLVHAHPSFKRGFRFVGTSEEFYDSREFGPATGFGLAAITDDQILLAATNTISNNVKQIFLYDVDTDTTTQVQSVLAADLSADTDVWPPRKCDKLLIQSNLDSSVGIPLEGEQFNVPLLVYGDDSSIQITVTPYPTNAAWYLTIDDFSVSNTEDIGNTAIQFGQQTITLNIVTPGSSGYSTCSVTAHSVTGALTTQLKFKIYL